MSDNKFSRRDVLGFFQKTLGIYGLSQLPVGLIDSLAHAAAPPPEYFVAILKHWGSYIAVDGPGSSWGFDGYLAPLAEFSGNIAIPLGLQKELRNPLLTDGHTLGQHSFLTGAPLVYENVTTPYFATPGAGGGKSIDLLIGETLQARFPNTRLRNLCYGQFQTGAGAAQKISPFMGSIQNKIFSYDPRSTDVGPQNFIYNFQELYYAIRGSEACSPAQGSTADIILRKWKVANEIKLLQSLVGRNQLYLTNKKIPVSEFSGITQGLASRITQLEREAAAFQGSSSVRPPICDLTSIQMQATNRLKTTEPTELRQRNQMAAELICQAFKSGATRSFTIAHNPIRLKAHSHPIGVKSLYDADINDSIVSVKDLILKLKEHGLFEKTVILYQSELTHPDEHSNHRVASFVVNAGPSGFVGSPTVPVPCSALLLDMLKLFSTRFTSFGSPAHLLGAATTGILKVG